ncbi:MAG: molecular chaperone DnaK, partial [Promethearchaeota archaeon]
GIVHVTAKDLGTGKETGITVTGANGLSEDEIEEKVRIAEQYEEEDKRIRELIETKNQAESMIYQTQKLMEDNKDKLEDTEKQKIENAIKSLEVDIKSDDINQIKQGIDNLTKAMHEFSQRIYASQSQQQAYQQAAEQAQRAAQGGAPGNVPGGMGGSPGKEGTGGASYKSESKEDEKKKVVDVDWDEED